MTAEVKKDNSAVKNWVEIGQTCMCYKLWHRITNNHDGFLSCCAVTAEVKKDNSAVMNWVEIGQTCMWHAFRKGILQ